MIPLGQNAGTVSPDICGAGLNLAGIVECATPQVVSIEADGLNEFNDYLGITCKIQQVPTSHSRESPRSAFAFGPFSVEIVGPGWVPIPPSRRRKAHGADRTDCRS